MATARLRERRQARQARREAARRLGNMRPEQQAAARSDEERISRRLAVMEQVRTQLFRQVHATPPPPTPPADVHQVCRFAEHCWRGREPAVRLAGASSSSADSFHVSSHIHVCQGANMVWLVKLY